MGRVRLPNHGTGHGIGLMFILKKLEHGLIELFRMFQEWEMARLINQHLAPTFDRGMEFVGELDGR